MCTKQLGQERLLLIFKERESNTQHLEVSWGLFSRTVRIASIIKVTFPLEKIKIMDKGRGTQSPCGMRHAF